MRTLGLVSKVVQIMALAVAALMMFSAQTWAQNGQREPEFFKNAASFPVDLPNCAYAYGHLGIQMHEDSQLAPNMPKISVQYPDFSKVDLFTRHNALIDRVKADTPGPSTSGTIEYLSRVKGIDNRVKFEILTAGRSGLADFPLPQTRQLRTIYQDVFSFISLCDQEFNFEPVTNATLGLPIPDYYAHVVRSLGDQPGMIDWAAAAAEKTSSMPAPARYIEQATNESCGGYYYVTAELLKAGNPQYGEFFFSKVRKMASDEAGGTDQARYDRSLQGYLRSGQETAKEIKDGSLSMRQLSDKLTMCDKAFDFPSADLSPYFQ